MKNNSLIFKSFLAITACYILFLGGKMIYQSYGVNSEVRALAEEIKKTEQLNKEYKEKIIYYQSNSYKEKIARERLGMQKPGEEVIVILPEERKPEDLVKPEDKLPNYQKWWNYFFG